MAESKLITNLDGWKTTKSWVDAYTATLEASFDAAMNPEIRDELQEAVKATQAQALMSKSEQDINIAKTQAGIARRVGGFTMEQYQLMRELWQKTAPQIVGTSWNLTEEVGYAVENPSDLSMRFWQGDAPEKNFMVLPMAQASLTIKFLKFVAAQSSQVDPITHTKRMLERQGINEHNFDQHADKLAITNPWKPTT